MKVLAKQACITMLKVMGLAASMASTNAAAGGFTISPTVMLTESYSNNLFLSDQSKVADWVTLINPGVSVDYQSTDIQLGLNYDISQQIVNDNSYLDMSYQEIDINLSAYQQENLSFTGGANVEQQPISAGNLTLSDIVVGNDHEEVKTGFVNPTLSLSNLNYTARGGYFFSLSRYERQPEVSSDIHSATLEAGSGRSHGPVMVSAKLNETHIDYVNVASGSSYFFDIYAQMAYQYSPTLQISYGRGKERNVDERSSIEQGGRYWQGGITYMPKSYMSLNLSSGEHYYGRSYAGELSYDRSRIEIDAGYEEETTSGGSTSLAFDSSDSAESDFRSYLPLSNNILLTKTLTSRIQYRLQRLRFQYSNEGIHRSSQEANLYERSYTHRLLLAYQMRRNDSLSVMYDRAQIWLNSYEGAREDGILSVNYLRHINREVSLDLEVSNQIMSGPSSANTYKEMQFMASVEVDL